MFVDLSSHSSYIYLKTLFTATILMITISPLLWMMSKGDLNWLLLSLILWTLGSIIIFYPFMEDVFPHLLTKTGFFLLTSILIIISTWFNITLITFLFHDNYIYNSLINITLDQLSLFISLYILLVSMLILKLNRSQPTEDNS